MSVFCWGSPENSPNHQRTKGLGAKNDQQPQQQRSQQSSPARASYAGNANNNANTEHQGSSRDLNFCERNPFFKSRFQIRRPSADLPEVPHFEEMNFPPPAKWRSGRRGSMQNVTPSSNFRAAMNGCSISAIDVEMQTLKTNSYLKKAHNWDFDVFTFKRVTGGCPLVHLGCHLLQEHDLFRKMGLDSFMVTDFLSQVEHVYHPDNYYHNSTHAADVTQAIHCLISESKLYSHLTPLEILATLVAAICHDLDHPGVNQDFLLQDKSACILKHIHGNKSMLERHHCFQARALIHSTRILEHLNDQERLEVLSLMDELIMATDVSDHKDYLNEFEAMIAAGNVDFGNEQHRRFLLKIAIKAADISNPARKLSISRFWSEKIMQEFFRQGDYERSMELKVSKQCDRYTTTIPKAQSDFFSYIVLPLFKAWSELFRNNFSAYLCNNIICNKAYWDSKMAVAERKEEPPIRISDNNTIHEEL